MERVSLCEALDRVLDKGIVIAGDIKIKLVDIELPSIQIRLMICSVGTENAVSNDAVRLTGFLRQG
jgi:hypothetical protein